MNNPKVFSFDYETFYSKTYSIKDLGNWAYVNHPEFDAYMLAVDCDEGHWVGNPKDFDWNLFEGQTMIAHNAGFEQSVTTRLIELGIIPNISFGALYDTADLAAYLGYPRSLAAAAEGLLGIKPDKSTRDKAKGLRWADMTPEFQEEMTKYAAQDAILERRLWLEHSDKWPEWERELSRLTREMVARGLPIDMPKVKAGIKTLQKKLKSTRAKIPWAAAADATVLSKKEMAIECAKVNLTPPKSMAKDSEEFEKWLRDNGDKAPFAKAMGEYRSMNAFLKKLETIQIRTRPDGVMPYSLKYFGAHPGRDSGDAGFNPQNLPREELYGVDMRGMITAPDGFTLGVVDLSAIEPCALSVLSGDKELAGLLRGGLDPYEAQARVDGEYDDPRPLKEVDKALRSYQKVKVLGCGYGAGPEKVQVIAKNMCGVELTLQQTEVLVGKFRSRPYITGLWKTLEKAMESATGKDFEMELPSGRVQRYRDVKLYGGLSAIIPRKGMMMRNRFWGGTLTENLVQGAARDVFMDRVIAIEKENLDVRLRVHDEVVCLFPEATADENLKTVIDIMSTPPAWWPELPISAEGHLCKAYKKE